MRSWRIFFAVAGVFNILGGLSGLLLNDDNLRRHDLPAPNYPFAFQLLFIAVMILGVGYLILARDPYHNRGIAWIGLLTKLAGFFMNFEAIYSGQLPAELWWQPMVNDLPWAIGFAAFLITTRPPLPIAVTLRQESGC